MIFSSRIISSLEKGMIHQRPEQFDAFEQGGCLLGETFSCQLAMRATWDKQDLYHSVYLTLEGDLAPYFTVREVTYISTAFPVFPNRTDDNYLSHEPGLYPDLLLPPPYFNGEVALLFEQLKCLWLSATIPEDFAPGEHILKVVLHDKDGKILATHTLTLDVIGLVLPDVDIPITQWFHCDCLANYYGVEVWSEEHWDIIENFARRSREMGNTMILTPIHTPPLDTAIGGERRTNQLVDVYCDDGVYSFGFERLDRYLSLMDRLGFRYFEMAHFFTQWGAAHAPKIVVVENGVAHKKFGWHTDALHEDYRTFLAAYLTALVDHLRLCGMLDRTYFHVSDEPERQHIEAYQAAKAIVRPYLAGRPIIDACSTLDFITDGIMETAIPANDFIDPFLEAKVENLWTYYCCGQCVNVANNLIAMPAYRTHSLAAQMYRYRIQGFLQWGYNFYNTRESICTVDPFRDTSAGHWVPSGDPFIVYPAPDGRPYDSLRLYAFMELLQDYRLLLLHERKHGREVTLALAEAHLGEIRFDRCATSSAPHIALRQALIRGLK